MRIFAALDIFQFALRLYITNKRKSSN